MLAFFGLLLFALMGVGALAIDVGVAELAQKRLESAAELVALESASGASSQKLRAYVAEVLPGAPAGRPMRLRLGPVGPLQAGDPACAGSLPDGSPGPAVLSQRVPLLFGQGSMLSFASPTSFGQILDARTNTVNPVATPVLPDSAIPPGRRALREQGFCVEGRGDATLVPALAVAGVAQHTLPGTTSGLSLLASDVNILWRNRGLTRETGCPDTHAGPWFKLQRGSETCKPGHATCTFPIGSATQRIGGSTRGDQAFLVPSAKPTGVGPNGTLVATLRGQSGEGVGFASLCAQRRGTSLFVAMRWSDAAMPFTAFTSELRNPAVRQRWDSVVRDLNRNCFHPNNADLRCLVQSAVLSLPKVGS